MFFYLPIVTHRMQQVLEELEQRAAVGSKNFVSSPKETAFTDAGLNDIPPPLIFVEIQYC